MSENRIGREPEDDEITIDLTELIQAVWSRIYIVIIAGIVCAVAAFVVTEVFITPEYTSETKVYVLSRQSDDSNLTYNDIQISNQLVNDYMELVNSRPVLEKTISILNLDMEPEQLSKMVSSQAADDSRILSIYVKSPDPVEAKEIADAIREAVAVQITDIMDAESVNTVEEASLPTSPSSPNVLRNTVFGGAAGVLIAIAIIVLVTILDDTIKTPDDVEHYLGLNVLASIPVQEGLKNSQKSRGLFNRSSSGGSSRSRSSGSSRSSSSGNSRSGSSGSRSSGSSRSGSSGSRSSQSRSSSASARTAGTGRNTGTAKNTTTGQNKEK